jgi:hypothetical protein
MYAFYLKHLSQRELASYAQLRTFTPSSACYLVRDKPKVERVIQFY